MDTKTERVKAFVRRFVQLLVAAGSGGIEFVAGGLFLLGEVSWPNYVFVKRYRELILHLALQGTTIYQGTTCGTQASDSEYG